MSVLRNNRGFWIAVIFVCAVGVLNHYLYEWSGNQEIIGWFAPKSEAISEHLKLLWFPFLLCTIAEYFLYGHGQKGFITARILGLAFGLAFIPAVFYLYTNIFGQHYLPVDIAIYFISVWLSFFMSQRIWNFFKKYP